MRPDSSRGNFLRVRLALGDAHHNRIRTELDTEMRKIVPLAQ
jgi:hypothetical protein